MLEGTYCFGHAETAILDRQGLVLLVGDDVNAEVLARVELAGVRQSLIPDLVEGIRGIGDEFSQENFFIGVDSVDDERQELRDLSLELERLGRHSGGCLGAICELALEGCKLPVEADSRRFCSIGVVEIVGGRLKKEKNTVAVLFGERQEKVAGKWECAKLRKI